MSYPNDFFTTLVAAGTVATQALQLPNNLLESVYVDYDANLATFGTTVNVVVPTVDENNASDIGNGGLTGVSPADSLVSVTINKKYSSNRKIPDFDQIRSNPVKLANLYMVPVIEEVLRKANRGLAGLFSSNPFTSSPVSGGTDDAILRADISKAWAALRKLGVPVGNPNDLSLIVDSDVYGNMMANSDFANYTVQGESVSSVNRRAVILNQYNATIKDDPMMPSLSGVHTGVLLHRYAIALRTALLGAPEGSAVIQTVVYPKNNIPVHVQLFYQPMDQAWYIHAFLPCGFAVARPSHGVLITTT